MTALSELPVARGFEAEPDAHLRQLYRTHAPALTLFLSQFTVGDRAATEELVRQTLLRASRSLDPARADLAAVGPWLLTLARRVALDHSRSLQAASVLGSREEQTTAAGRAVVRRLPDADLARALTRVSEDDRRIIVALFWRGRSVAETAMLLGIPETSVAERGLAALRALRSVIEQNRHSG
jgi:RNA polymerase sigma-70 factor (ECF subfamily)